MSMLAKLAAKAGLNMPTTCSHDGRSSCAVCTPPAIVPPEPKYVPDHRIKAKCEMLGRTAHRYAASLNGPARTALLRSCGADWDGTTTTTTWAGGARDANNGVVNTLRWELFAHEQITAAEQVQPKGEGANFATGRSKNGGRCDIDCFSITQFGLDCDGKGWPDALLREFTSASIAYVLSPSSSSTPEKMKWHFHMPLAQALEFEPWDADNKNEYRMIHAWCTAWFSVLAEAEFDVTIGHALLHVWYPGYRRSEDAEPHRVSWSGGKAFDLKGFLERTDFAKAVEEATLELARKPPPLPIELQTDYTEEEIVKKAIDWIARRPARSRETDGQNGTLCLRVAGDLVKGFCLDEDVALDIMERHYNPRCDIPWTEVELRHKLESVLTGPREEGDILNFLEQRDRDDEMVRGAFRSLMAKREVAAPRAAWECVADGDDAGPALEEDWANERAQLIAYISAAYDKNTMARRAMESELVQWAALLPENGAQFIALEADLQALGMSVAAWKKSVRAARISRAVEKNKITTDRTEFKRTKIEIKAGKAKDANDQIVKNLVRLKELGSPVYSMGQQLVDLVFADSDTYIRILDRFSLGEKIESVCQFYTMEGFEDPVAVPRDVSDRSVMAVLARKDWPQVDVFKGILPYPFFKPSGESHTGAGFDRETGLFFQPNFVPLPMPPDEELTPQRQRQALDLLMYAVKDFPFKDANSTSVQETSAETFERLAKSHHFAAFLAGFITPCTRPAYEAPAPGFACSGNRRGVGKDKLKELQEATWLGYEMAPGTQNTGDNAEIEDRKWIMSQVMQAPAMVCIGNIRGAFGNSAWEHLLTSTVWSDRLLRTNDAPKYDTRITWYFQGNQLEWSGDMPRRVIQYTLETKLAQPQTRGDLTEPDLIGWVRKNRAALVQAAMIIVRAWTMTVTSVEALKNMSTTGSYDMWSRVVRGAIVNAGLRDPWTLNVAEGVAGSDADADVHTWIMDGLEEIMKDMRSVEVGATDILRRVQENNDKSAVWRMTREPVRYESLRNAFGAALPRLKEGEVPSRDALTKVVLKPRLVSPRDDGRILRKDKNSRGNMIYFIEYTKPDVYPAPDFAAGASSTRTGPSHLRLVTAPIQPSASTSER